MNNKKYGLKSSVLLKYIVALIFILVTPSITNDYSMQVLNVALIMTISAFSLSIMLGMGGMLTFSGVTFMGIGAYTVANLTSGRLGFIMNTSEGLIYAVILATIISFLLGLLLLRLRGTFFTFSTIALVQVSWSFFMNFKPLTGGPDGISRIPVLSIFGWAPTGYTEWFFLLVIIVFLCALFVERIRHTRLGRSLAAIRDNEIAAQCLGVNIYRTKVIAFTLAGALSGLAGGLYAMHGGFISADIFTFDMSTTYIIIAMLGGINDSFGIVVGSLLVNMLPEWLRPLQKYIRLIYGIGVIMLMIYMPMGLAGLGTEIGKKLKKKFKREEVQNI